MPHSLPHPVPHPIGFTPSGSTPSFFSTQGQLNFSGALPVATFSNVSRGGYFSVIGQALTRSADRHRVNYQSSTSTHLDETHEPIDNNLSSVLFYCSAFAFFYKKWHDGSSLNPRRYLERLFLDCFSRQQPVTQEPESELNPLSPRQEGEEQQHIIINIPPEDGRDFDYSSPSPRLRFRGAAPLETNSYIAGHDVVEPETRGISLRNFVAQQLGRVLRSAEDGMQEGRRIV